MLCSCVENLDFITPVVLNLWPYVPALELVMGPCAPSVGFLWTMTLVTGGAKDLLLNSKFPSIIAHDEIFGLLIEGLIMSNMICA